MKKVLILTTSTGLGHNQAAKSLIDVFEKNDSALPWKRNNSALGWNAE